MARTAPQLVRDSILAGQFLPRSVCTPNKDDDQVAIRVRPSAQGRHIPVSPQEGGRPTESLRGFRVHAGVCRLPGLSAPLRLVESVDARGNLFAIVSALKGARYTIVLAAGDGDLDAMSSVPNEDPEEWAHTLGGIADKAGATGVSVTLAVSETRHSSLIGFTWADKNMSAKSGRLSMRRKRRLQEVSTGSGHVLPRISSALEGFNSRPFTVLSGAHMAATLRMSYDPSVTGVVHEATNQGKGPGWSEAGPGQSKEEWGHYVHDGAASITWVSPGAPSRDDILAFLDQRENLGVVRITVQIGDVGRDGDAKVSSIFTATSREIQDLEYLPSIGDVFPDRLRIRRMYGGQAAAFVAGLPLGLTAPDLLSRPRSAF